MVPHSSLLWVTAYDLKRGVIGSRMEVGDDSSNRLTWQGLQTITQQMLAFLLFSCTWKMIINYVLNQAQKEKTPIFAWS